MLVTVGLLWGHPSAAADDKPVAVCEVRLAGGLQRAAAARAEWVNGQISQGRTHCVSDVPGIMCAW
jgi:hypothetical protein